MCHRGVRYGTTSLTCVPWFTADCPRAWRGTQEAGRAGRDGDPAHCTLLYGDADMNPGRIEYLLEGKSSEDRARTRRDLQEVWDYAHCTGCRRSVLVRHFGDVPSSESCGVCDNCVRRSGGAPRSEITGGSSGVSGVSGDSGDSGDSYISGGSEGSENSALLRLRASALALLRVVRDTRGRFGVALVVDVAQGRRGATVTRRGFDALDSHGAAREVGVAPDGYWRGVFHALAAHNDVELGGRILEPVICDVQGRTFTTYDLGPGGKEFLRRSDGASAPPELHLVLPDSVVAQAPRIRSQDQRDGRTSGKKRCRDSSDQCGEAVALSPEDAALFSKLSQRRRELAKSLGVPPYCVFADRTLRSMASVRPETLEDMGRLYGVGESKLNRFGGDFLAVVVADGFTFFE